ncbi:MAG: type II toxin-antitoxin system PemK/MazF family toxin [Polaromonas sp.]
MPFSATPAFGDVVLVPFPFTSGSAAKQRPAVIVSNQAYAQARPDVVLLAITSQVRMPLSFGEALVADWQAAGLLKISLFKPLLATLEQALIIRQLGQLSNADQAALRQTLDVILK